MEMKFNEFESRYINLLTDFGFHKIFGTESNKDLLMDFLNQVIKEEGLIVDIKYLNPEQLGDFETDRKAVFDIFCITEKEEYFIVEMQKANQAFFRDRSLYYASLPIQKQALKGDWNFRLNKVYFVAVLDFVLLMNVKKTKSM
jgi:predicted transposase/invertase (TIGR01784 family)